MQFLKESLFSSIESRGRKETGTDFIFSCSKITVDRDCSHEIKRRLLLVREAMTNLDSILKSKDITLLTKVHIVKGIAFLVVQYGCDSRTVKKLSAKKLTLLNQVLEKTVENSLECKEIKPVNPKGSQSRIFIGRADSEAEAPKLWPPDIKCQLVGKDSLLLGKIEGRRRGD